MKKMLLSMLCLIAIGIFYPINSFGADNYIYFDLSKGDVTITESNYSGYVLKSDNTVSNITNGTHINTNKYYIYQSNGESKKGSFVNGNFVSPSYSRIKGGEWGNFITNNQNLNQIVTQWDSDATSVGRAPTEYKINITGSSSYDITIDNIWSSYQLKSTSRKTGGISFIPSSKGKVMITLKGDNRLGNIHFYSPKNSGGLLTFQDYSKSINNATLTVMDLSDKIGYNHYNSAIGGNDVNCDSDKIIINSGIIYAGTFSEDNCTAIGAGGNGYANIEINGGRITAVSNSSGAAIGGGIGESSEGGDAKIVINGGEVFAYNKGYVSNLSGKKEFIPAAAIGGGSSCKSNGNLLTEIKIVGGKVYAESIGGVAAGGGSSTTLNGGSAEIEISGNADVIAISVGGIVDGITVLPGACIGGGTGGYSGHGGDATLIIKEDAIVNTGSIGGGYTNWSEGQIGSAIVKISGGVLHGQVIMEGTDSLFEITDGIINNSYIGEDREYSFLEENGGAVCMFKGEANIKGGIIKSCSAIKGGAIYVENGTVTMSNGRIEECSAIEDGGAIFLSGGDFTMKGGNIGRIEENKKLGSRAVQGGAIYVTGGSFTMSGGTIEGNTATDSGGGIQISNGNVYMSGGKITSNVARGEDESADVGYGGGIFVDGGQIVNITGGEISKNIAARNGGGIEIKTNKVVTVDIYSGSFIDNVADACGGALGIECDNGTINVGKVECDGSSTSGHIHPVLSGNLAGVQGGGFYMTGKDAVLNIYCGEVDNNIVVDIENNFDQSSGTVTVYEGVKIGDANEGVIVIGGTFIDKRNTEQQKYTVMYYSNYNGSTEYKEALVTKGTLLTLPGDIFGITDYEIIGWTKDKNNITEIEYRAGQTIEITEEITLYAIWILEEKNEASYVIVIPTEVNFSDDVETMKFDIKATLTLFPRNRMLNVIVSEEEFILKLLENGMEKDKIKFELIRESKKINPGDVVASFGSDSALVAYEGREEIGITVIDNPKYVGYYKGVLTFFMEIIDI